MPCADIIPSYQVKLQFYKQSKMSSIAEVPQNEFGFFFNSNLFLKGICLPRGVRLPHVRALGRWEVPWGRSNRHKPVA